jgi:hypothetical protein
MANLYFDVRHLPRHFRNQKQFEVVMNYSDQLLRLREDRDESSSKSSKNRVDC